MISRSALYITVIVLLIVASTALLIVTIGESGVRLTGDTDAYLGAAQSLARGDGFEVQFYSAGDDTIVSRHISHYPPLMSAFMGLFIFFGIHPAIVLTIVSVCGWMLLLVAAALYVYTSTKSYVASLLATLLTAITYPNLLFFGENQSEVLFLPFLLLTIAFATLYKQTDGQKRRYLVLLCITLALAMMSRYLGVLLFGAVCIWWLWWRLNERALWEKWREAFLIALSATPLPLWISYNWFLSISKKPIGNHFGESEDTFLDGLVTAFYEISYLLLPSIKTGSLKYIMGQAQWAMYLLAAGLIIVILWRYVVDQKPRFVPPESPALLFCAIYVLFFIVVPPFMTFPPLMIRYATPVFVVVLPVFIILAFNTRGRLGPVLAGGYVGLNLLLLILSTFVGGNMDFVRVSQGAVVVDDLAGDFQKLTSLRRDSALPRWLLRHPPRASHLVEYHQDLYDWLRAYATPYVVLGEHFYKDILIPYGIGPLGNLEAWLEEGTCTPKQDLVLVVFRWGNQRDQARSVEESIRTRCSQAQRLEFSSSIVYTLPREIEPPGLLPQERSN